MYRKDVLRKQNIFLFLWRDYFSIRKIFKSYLMTFYKITSPVLSLRLQLNLLLKNFVTHFPFHI
jgi:hypothetical protein